ncbi:YihY/virulence factor BrkB family protein [Nitrosophilus labii]|uniref:YihY/virulence factor BrkB family protein n=1 Tax=Nitrosophilus labii TaxID=2706014 RepID=UPI0018D6F7A3|nr:YihY family inner membrane protein [Nitrosophilus labii]
MRKKIINLYKNIYDENITLYASSLSFHTIFSIIPLLLISFSLFTKMPSFEKYYDKIKEFIFSNLMPTHQETVSKYLESFLQNSEKLGIIGFVFVIFASLMFFQNFEYIVNKIFKTKQRGIWQSITTYWTLVTLGPIALALSFFLSKQIQELLNRFEYTSWINFLSIFPYLIIWGLFFITYIISANIKISPKAALISSFAASLTWYISKSLFVYYVIYSKTYLTIYGSSSVILFFFLWIYISWIIFLYGLKLCYLINKKRDIDEDKEVEDPLFID